MPHSICIHPALHRLARGTGGTVVIGAAVVLFSGCSAEPTPAPETLPPLTAAQQASTIALGKAIASETFGVLSTNLQTALAAGGISNALPFCSLAAPPLTASVSQRHGVKVRRMTHKPRNPDARASAAEVAMLDGFRAALFPGGSPPPPLATNLVPGHATFLAPIVISNDLCLKCHGELDKDISPTNLAFIRQHYPQDEATGFKLGDLRGAWRIDLPLAKLGDTATNNASK